MSTETTVSTEAIHSLATEMVDKVIAAQKKEVDEMIKEAESYVSKLKSAMEYNNIIVGQGDMTTGENDELDTIKIKRVKTKLDGADNISNVENILTQAKKQHQIYNELIEDFKRYCSNMHGSADKIEEAMERLVEELDPASTEEKTTKSLLEDEEIDSEDIDSEEIDDEVEKIDTSDNISTKITDEEASTLKALFKEYGIPIPTDLDVLLKDGTTPTSTVTPQSNLPTQTPTELEKEPIILPPAENTGYGSYTPAPAVETPPEVEAPPSIDSVIKGRITTQIPTSSAPIAKVETKAKTKTSGSALITTTSGVAAATLVGLGAKAYLDKKKTEEEDKQAETLLLETNNNDNKENNLLNE